MQLATQTSSVSAVTGVADEEFHAMACGDVAAFLRILAPDVVFFPPNEVPKSGAAVATWIGAFLTGYEVEFLQHAHDEVLLAEDWALLRTSFRWKVVARASREDFVRLGNTVRVFRRQEDGRWQLAREIWTTYPAT